MMARHQHEERERDDVQDARRKREFLAARLEEAVGDYAGERGRHGADDGVDGDYRGRARLGISLLHLEEEHSPVDDRVAARGEEPAGKRDEPHRECRECDSLPARRVYLGLDRVHRHGRQAFVLRRVAEEEERRRDADEAERRRAPEAALPCPIRAEMPADPDYDSGRDDVGEDFAQVVRAAPDAIVGAALLLRPPTRKRHDAARRTGRLGEAVDEPDDRKHQCREVEADKEVDERGDEEPEHYVFLDVYVVGDEAIDDLADRVREKHRRANVADLRRRVGALLYHPLLRRREGKSAHVEYGVDEQHRPNLAYPGHSIPFLHRRFVHLFYPRFMTRAYTICHGRQPSADSRH